MSFMRLVLTIKEKGNRKTWDEVYVDRTQDPTTYGESIMRIWNRGLRPDEKPRTIRKAVITHIAKTKGELYEV